MKDIVQYIKEGYDTYLVENLKVVFDVLPEEFFINAPNKYSESDIQIYLGDSLLEYLPADDLNHKNLLGKNYNNIADSYFEYDKFEHLQDSDIDDFNLEWDSEYDDKVKEDELDIFKLTGLKYIILFDEFELKDDKNDINEILDKIFSKYDSSNINEYPIEIKYNPELLEYKK